mmetsp:Transcript_22452/g.33253  ORF Transcript_22452/g.33253 Transcript_22452/m.33253 type:complete len:191 (-) Transcript_22452:124-696(-)
MAKLMLSILSTIAICNFSTYAFQTSFSTTNSFITRRQSAFNGDANILRKTRTSTNMLPQNSFSLLIASSETEAASTITTSATEQFTTSPPIEGLSPTANIIIFIIGLIPFIWATYEFWSRIAVGASFGTGADSIQIRPSGTTIGKDGDPLTSRGQQVLGDDALVVAYFLFAVAIASVGIAIYSVVSSPAM